MQPKTIIQAINRWENVLIEAIALSVIFVSAAVTANYFGWPSPDPTVKAAAAVYAFGVDGMFYICVRLARHYLSYGLGSKGLLGLFWMLFAGGMGAFTWHNNLLFAATSWHISADALARVGISDAEELQLHAIIPVVVVLIVALIPRRKAKDERTPEEILAEAQREIARAEAKNQVRAARAKVAGAGLRGTVSNFAGQVLNSEEKQRQQEARDAQRAAERRRSDQIEAERRQMYNLATLAELDAATDEEGDLVYDRLARILREAGKWPPTIGALSDVEMLQEAAIREEQEEDMSDSALSALTPSGRHRTWMTDKEVLDYLNLKDIRTARRWMSAEYKGPYKIEGCITRKKTRRAPIASVRAVREKRDHEATLAEQPITH